VTRALQHRIACLPLNAVFHKVIGINISIRNGFMKRFRIDASICCSSVEGARRRGVVQSRRSIRQSQGV
jgi:hypothetical protein